MVAAPDAPPETDAEQADDSELADAGAAPDVRDDRATLDARTDALGLGDTVDEASLTDGVAGDAPLDASTDAARDARSDGDDGGAGDGWAWVPVDGTRCGNGSTAGFGIRARPGSRAVMMFLMGGGACWDGPTCFGPALLRTVYHLGARNMAAFLDVLAARLPGTERVWLLGASAGGYGAEFNAPRVQAAFPSARVDVLADGAPLVTPWGGRREVIMRAWNLTFPSDCATCAARWEDYVPWLATHLRAPRRTALITFAQDPTIGAYFNYPLADLSGPISRLLANDYARAPRSGYFTLSGAGHVALHRYRTATSAGGAPLQRWVRAWATDDPAWRNAP